MSYMVFKKLKQFVLFFNNDVLFWTTVIDISFINLFFTSPVFR